MSNDLASACRSVVRIRHREVRRSDRSGPGIGTTQGGDGMSRYLRTGALAMAGAILAGTVGAAAAVAQDPVEIDWWHLDINDPGQDAPPDRSQTSTWQMHPDVKINVTVLENEALKSALAVEMQAGNAPDIFQSWGGGILAEQVDAGMVQTHRRGQLDDWDRPERGRHERLAGRRRAVRRALQPSAWSASGTTRTSSHRRASTSRPPRGTSSWRTCRRSRTPASRPSPVAGQDKWPAMFYWAYLALRIGGQAGLRGGHRHGQLGRTGLRRGRQPAPASHRPGALPGGLPGSHV